MVVTRKCIEFPRVAQDDGGGGKERGAVFSRSRGRDAASARVGRNCCVPRARRAYRVDLIDPDIKRYTHRKRFVFLLFLVFFFVFYVFTSILPYVISRPRAKRDPVDPSPSHRHPGLSNLSDNARVLLLARVVILSCLVSPCYRAPFVYLLARARAIQLFECALSHERPALRSARASLRRPVPNEIRAREVRIGVLAGGR